jgi:hypothetical protein
MQTVVATRRAKPSFGHVPQIHPQIIRRTPEVRGVLRGPRLTVGAVNDPAEREADQVAGQVMRMAEPGVTTDDPGPPSIARHGGGLQRMCADCEDEQKQGGKLQRRGTNASAGAPDAAPPSVHNVLRSSGQPLDTATRAFMEPRFGQDFGAVRIHADGAAHASARDVSARAYAVGPNIVFGAGQYDQSSAGGRHLIAHELTHVLQQSGASQDAPARLRRSTGATGTGTATPPTPALPTPTPGPAPAGAPTRVEVDVLAAQGDNFLVRAAAEDLGVDLTVTSMSDMITQLVGRVGTGSCLASLDIFNHANPAYQMVAGGNKAKLPTGKMGETPRSGFSLNWLGNDANQASLNSLRGLFCCGSELRWQGCSTAGVWAEGDTRAADEIKSNEHRFGGTFGHWYHTIEEAAAHGAKAFGALGPVNVQSWANALCTPVSGATDFTYWNSSGKRVIRTIGHGGAPVRVSPQADMGCACDTATQRISGAAPTAAQINDRAAQLREQALLPMYQEARNVLGTPVTPAAESDTQKADREKLEQSQAEQTRKRGELIRANVATRAGFTGGTLPKTPDEALRVTTLWNLPINKIVAAFGSSLGTVPDRPRGAVGSDDLNVRQRDFEAALTPKGRETFMEALRAVRREPFWDKYLQNHTVYVFPDLTGTNRYRGYTQRGSHKDDATGRTMPVYIIHISQDLLNNEQTELVTTNLVHELTHTVDNPVSVESAMESFQGDLAELLADHPQVKALRAAAADATASRQEHVARIRQMLHEVTGYAEGEIMSLLQQFTYQPAMDIGGTTYNRSHFVLEQVTIYAKQLVRIGMPTQMQTNVFNSIQKRTAALYDSRVAAFPAGSPGQERVKSDKTLALMILKMAVDEANSGP